MGAHRPRHASAGGARCSDVAAIGHVRTATPLVGMQEIRANHLSTFFSDEYFVSLVLPVAERLCPGHIAGQSVSFTGADGGFENFPYCGGIGRAGRPDG